MMKLNPCRLYLLTALAILTVGVLSIFVGTELLPPTQVIKELRSGLAVYQCPALSIIFFQRIPRTLAAFLAGGGLALAGCAFQALLRNPLATPYTLGVASAGALGAWIAALMIDAGWLMVGLTLLPLHQIFAFLFAGLDILLIYYLATRRRQLSPAILLLAGVTLGMLANAGMMLSRYLAQPDRIVSMDRWLMGGVDIIGYGPVLALLLGVLPCAILLILQANRFDQYAFNAEMASGRGVNIRRLQLITFLAASLMTAVIVSKVGPIGFVGLIVPHSVRVFTGARHRILLPMSMIMGGLFLCCCDIGARVILPGETPIGIITTFSGAPFFLYLLLRRGFIGWDA